MSYWKPSPYAFITIDLSGKGFHQNSNSPDRLLPPGIDSGPVPTTATWVDDGITFWSDTSIWIHSRDLPYFLLLHSWCCITYPSNLDGSVWNCILSSKLDIIFRVTCSRKSCLGKQFRCVQQSVYGWSWWSDYNSFIFDNFWSFRIENTFQTFQSFRVSKYRFSRKTSFPSFPIKGLTESPARTFFRR